MMIELCQIAAVFRAKGFVIVQEDYESRLVYTMDQDGRQMFACQIKETLDGKINYVLQGGDAKQPIKTIIKPTISEFLLVLGQELDAQLHNRVKILEAGIEAALVHLNQDSFRSQAISHAKSRLDKALKHGRY